MLIGALKGFTCVLNSYGTTEECMAETHSVSLLSVNKVPSHYWVQQKQAEYWLQTQAFHHNVMQFYLTVFINANEEAQWDLKQV